MSDLEALKARIRAMQARTTARGCTEAEALAATAKVLEMMREHGLTDDQVACGNVVVSLGRRARTQVDRLWALVAEVCHCEAYMRTGGVTPLSIVYTGRLPWPDVAAWMHGVITGAAARAMRDFTKSPIYRARRTDRTRTAARRHFITGFVDGLSLTLHALMREDAAAQARADDIAVARRALANMEFGKTKPIARPKATGAFAPVADAGVTAGLNTSVNWGVAGGKPKLLGQSS
jgi:hypothetical protein